MLKRIFSKSIKFEAPEEILKLVASSLNLYDDGDADSVDVIIQFQHGEQKQNLISNNPKIFGRMQDGFQCDFGSALVSWKLPQSAPLQVIVSLREVNYRSPTGYINRIKSMEYPTKIEWFEQVLYELILIPTTYFFTDIAPIHAAAIGSGDKSILLTGTGGVGKSSGLLAIVDKENLGFLADDVAVLGSNGKVYSNFAWPKVYGYNCIGNSVEERVLKERGIIDKLHFKIKNHLNSSKVRRKIRPENLFSQCIQLSPSLDYLYFLVKEDTASISTTELDKKSAIDMACAVMSAEYAVFHKFLDWEEYNAKALGLEPILTMENVRKCWINIFHQAFPERITKVSIPLEVDHRQYQDWICQVIEGQLGEQ